MARLRRAFSALASSSESLTALALATACFEDVPHARVLVAYDDVLQLDQLGVLLARPVRIVLGRVHTVDEHTLLLVTPGRHTLVGFEPAAVTLIGRLRLRESGLNLPGLRGHIGEHDGEVVRHIAAPLLALHRHPELAA